MLLRRQSQFTTPGRGEFEGVADFYDHLMRGVPYDEWVDYVEALLHRWEARPEDVLDLACGTGQVGAEMARRGYHVWGADLSEPMVRHCCRRDPPVPAIVSDARALGLRSQAFDLVVSLYDSLNYILDLQGFQAAMQEAYRVLRPKGLLIFDLNTIRALSTEMFSQSSLAGPDPLQYNWKAQWKARERICRVDMWFAYRHPDGHFEEFEETHYQRAYTGGEVTGALRKAGFRSFKSYHAYRFTPVTPWSDRAYYVARKE
ncbi:MAG: class I SAM-dependent methyltransferase [Armatimonadetes bacterium]|nr:class I SAM-dependent methyltransferase [Armatimonadota bacterium]